jgi:hypothetical protein
MALLGGDRQASAGHSLQKTKGQTRRAEDTFICLRSASHQLADRVRTKLARANIQYPIQT